MAAKRREYNKSTALSQAMVDQFDLFLNPNKGNCTILRVNPEGNSPYSEWAFSGLTPSSCLKSAIHIHNDKTLHSCTLPKDQKTV